MVESLHLPMAASLDEELWRRAESRREEPLREGFTPIDQSLLALTLSMARLSAQQDARECACNETPEGELHA